MNSLNIGIVLDTAIFLFPAFLYLTIVILSSLVIIKWKKTEKRIKLSKKIKITLFLYIISFVLHIIYDNNSGFNTLSFFNGDMGSYLVSGINSLLGVTFLMTILFIITNFIRLIVKWKDTTKRRSIFKQFGVLVFIILLNFSMIILINFRVHSSPLTLP